jgi:hypothetical protein
MTYILFSTYLVGFGGFITQFILKKMLSNDFDLIQFIGGNRMTDLSGKGQHIKWFSLGCIFAFGTMIYWLSYWIICKFLSHRRFRTVFKDKQ